MGLEYLRKSQQLKYHTEMFLQIFEINHDEFSLLVVALRLTKFILPRKYLAELFNNYNTTSSNLRLLCFNKPVPAAITIELFITPPASLTARIQDLSSSVNSWSELLAFPFFCLVILSEAGNLPLGASFPLQLLLSSHWQSTTLILEIVS